MDENSVADDVITGSLKRSRSYHADYGNKTYKELKQLARSKPPDTKARQMKKLMEQVQRLREKARKRPS
jgi:hypothetical protein